MAEGGVIFTADAAARISDVVRVVEDSYRNRRPVLTGRPAANGGTATVFARITSATKDGNGCYPATLTQWQPDTLGWVDFATVKVLPLNGEKLSNGVRYAVQAAGQIGTDAIYINLGLTGTFVTSVSCSGGTLTVTDNS